MTATNETDEVLPGIVVPIITTNETDDEVLPVIVPITTTNETDDEVIPVPVVGTLLLLCDSAIIAASDDDDDDDDDDDSVVVVVTRKGSNGTTTIKKKKRKRPCYIKYNRSIAMMKAFFNEFFARFRNDSGTAEQIVTQVMEEMCPPQRYIEVCDELKQLYVEQVGPDGANDCFTAIFYAIHLRLAKVLLPVTEMIHNDSNHDDTDSSP